MAEAFDWRENPTEIEDFMYVLANPRGFKVCRGCEQIVFSGETLCECLGHNFDGDLEAVLMQAARLRVQAIRREEERRRRIIHGPADEEDFASRDAN